MLRCALKLTLFFLKFLQDAICAFWMVQRPEPIWPYHVRVVQNWGIFAVKSEGRGKQTSCDYPNGSSWPQKAQIQRCTEGIIYRYLLSKNVSLTLLALSHENYRHPRWSSIIWCLWTSRFPCMALTHISIWVIWERDTGYNWHQQSSNSNLISCTCALRK